MQEGNALKYGNNINTDIISPPQYMELPVQEAARYAMSAVDADFYRKVKQGDIFVAGSNLGSGSSRETAPLTLKYLGVSVVAAKSFARIFYRNLINIGIPAIECKDTDKIREGDRLRVDVEEGYIYNVTRSERYKCQKLPPHLMKIIEAGGLFQYLKEV